MVDAAPATKETMLAWSREHFPRDKYARDHAERFAETAERAGRYLSPDSAVATVGTYGHIEALLREFAHVQVVFYGLADGMMSLPDGRQVRQFFYNLEAPGAMPPAQTYDVVLLMEVLEHLREHPLFALQRLRDWLRPGGMLLLTTPNPCAYRSIRAQAAHYRPYLWPVYETGRGGMAHVKEYGKVELDILIAAAGFEIVEHETFSPYQDELRGTAPELEQALTRLGYDWRFAGSTHWIVARRRELDRGEALPEYCAQVYDV